MLSVRFLALVSNTNPCTDSFSGGHKAKLNNPNTSEESKQHSKEVLDQEYNGGNVESSGDKNPQNVAGGLKAYVCSSIRSCGWH